MARSLLQEPFFETAFLREQQKGATLLFALFAELAFGPISRISENFLYSEKFQVLYRVLTEQHIRPR